MRCIAHRGFAETYPENTITAVRSAAEHTDVIEIDVRRCSSGEPVVIHDETVERVTGGTGRVDELSTQELTALDVLGSGDGVPTLASLLEATPADVDFVFDLKAPGVAADALDAADDAGVEAIVSAFSADVLEAAAAAGADRLAFLVAEGGDAGMLNVAQDLGCEAIHPHWQLCVDEFVDRAHEAGLSVNAWTVPSRHDAEALAQVGVDGIIVDRPAVYTD